MIIFYHKNTKEILGTVNGRVHGEEEMKMVVSPVNIPLSEIGRYIVPFKTEFEMVEEPQYEQKVCKKTGKVETFLVGTKKVKRGKGMSPDVPFADLILDFEKGKKKIYDYHIKLNKKGKVEGFEKI